MKYLGVLLFLTITIFGTDCGRGPRLDVAPEAVEYISRFEVLGNLKVQDLTVKFGTLKGTENIVGLCVIEDDGSPPTITLDRDYWYSVADVQREELVFHELGHCVLGRQHLNDLLSDQCAKSLMHWETIAKWCLDRHRSEYEKEIFVRT